MTSTTRPTTRYGGTPVQKAAVIVGAVFLLVGVAGFIPGLTTDLESIAFAGHMSEAMLLGIFQVSVLHNIVHLIFGIAGVGFAISVPGSRNYLIWGGVVYAILLVYGLFLSGDHPANFVPLNAADNWLHAGLAIGMVVLGLLLPPRRGDRRVGDRTGADRV
jgi:hypothetical protein